MINSYLLQSIKSRCAIEQEGGGAKRRREMRRGGHGPRCEEIRMIKELNPKYYFKQPIYSELFERTENVWEVLPRIKEFIKTKGKALGIIVGEGTKIEDGAVIQPPAIIGDNCEIRAGSYLRGNVIIGDRCVIRSEIKNSIIMNNSNATHLSYIGDSIIGSNCNLGAGTILSNLKLGEYNVKVKFNGKMYDTGLKKFGAIIGDNTHIGCNVVTNPGTLIGKNCKVYSNAVLRGVYASNNIIKLRQSIELCEKK